MGSLKVKSDGVLGGLKLSFPGNAIDLEAFALIVYGFS